MIVNINVRNDGDGYCIGSVVAPTNMAEDEVRSFITWYFDTWREAVPHPECDSDFIQWLVKRGWKKDKNEYITMYFD